MRDESGHLSYDDSLAVAMRCLYHESVGDRRADAFIAARAAS